MKKHPFFIFFFMKIMCTDSQYKNCQNIAYIFNVSHNNNLHKNT